MMCNLSFLCNRVQNTPNDCNTYVWLRTHETQKKVELKQAEGCQSSVTVSLTKKHSFSRGKTLVA